MVRPVKKYLETFISEEEMALLETIEKFVEREVIPKRLDLEGGWHRDEKLATETLDDLYAKLVKLGYQKIGVPKEYGGLEISTPLRMALNEELARGDAGFAFYAAKTHSVVGPFVATGNLKKAQEYSEKLIGDDCWTAALAISEPQGGVNVEDPALHGKTIRTRAAKKGDEWIINGHKIWVGPAGPPEIFQREKLKGHLGYSVVATVDPHKGDEGIVVFHVPAETPGLLFSKPVEKMGMCFTDRNCEVWFDNVRVPDELRTGGVEIMRSRITTGRLSLAARCVGVAQAAFEIALEFMKEREIANKPVREHSLFAAQLGEIAAKIEACRAYYLCVAKMFDMPEKYGPKWSDNMLGAASAARLMAGKMVMDVLNRVMEFMGAYGYCFDCQVEKFLRDAKILVQGMGGPQRDALDSIRRFYSFEW
uniref:Acyl-CoA dehydrogenase n=1 Tax=candidate division WOR-3 bacterium TaxID=2052148 RepID=A0A7C2P0H3_UNCW3